MFGPLWRGGNQRVGAGAILLWVALATSVSHAQDVPSLPDWQLEAQARKGRGKIGSGVEAAVDGGGSVRVVVTLQRPRSLKRPERSRFAEIKRDIQASQNAVIGTLAPGEYGLNRRYLLVPAFAATIP